MNKSVVKRGYCLNSHLWIDFLTLSLPTTCPIRKGRGKQLCRRAACDKYELREISRHYLKSKKEYRAEAATLKPCPHCGSSGGETIKTQLGEGWNWVWCDFCDASGPSVISALPAMSIIAWNRRVGDEQED